MEAWGLRPNYSFSTDITKGESPVSKAIRRVLAKSAQEKKRRKSSKDIERSQGEAAGDRGEADWEKAGEEKREDA